MATRVDSVRVAKHVEHAKPEHACKNPRRDSDQSGAS